MYSDMPNATVISIKVRWSSRREFRWLLNEVFSQLDEHCYDEHFTYRESWSMFGSKFTIYCSPSVEHNFLQWVYNFFDVADYKDHREK